MTEITSKIESIRNMTEDLNSIKIVSQKNTEKMFQDLADFRNRICHEMSKIETIYQSGRNHKRKEKRKIEDLVSSNFDSKQINFILNEIENVQKKSKQMLMELESYSEPLSDCSTSLSKMHIAAQPTENYQSSTDTFGSCSNSDEVNVLFSKQLPNTGNISESEQTNKEPGSISPSFGRVTSDKLNNENSKNENDVLMTKDKIDNLTKKLKDIQTQNDELRNVNENIQNLLIKLSDLKYVDAETVEKLETVKKESQLSGLSYLSRMDSEIVLKDEDYQKYTRSVQMTSKCAMGFILARISCCHVNL